MDKVQKKLGLYIRVSSEKQMKEGFSFEDQEEKLIAEADREKSGYIVYRDGGISGTKTEHRTGLKQLMIDVELGLISKVYVTKISRLARNSRDLQNIIYEFEKNNVFFKSISDGIDTSTPMGNVMVKLMGIFAEMERDTIMEQTRAGLMKRAKEGKMYGSGPILGFDRVIDEESKKNTTKIIINEKEKPIIETIFQMYLGGHGYKAITNRLNSEGLRTKRHKLFSINTVKNTLDNPLYAGYIRYGKFKDWTKKRRKGLNEDYVLVEGDHDAIITKSEWDQVQVRMKQNQRRKPPVGSFLLSGVLTCPECGSKMIGTKTKYKTKKGIVERRYYTCSQFHNKGLTACHSNGIRTDLIDPIAIKGIIKKFNKDGLARVLNDYINTNTLNQSTTDGRIRILELEIEKQSSKKMALRELYTDGIITISELKEDLKKIDNKTEEHATLLQELKSNQDVSEEESFNITLEICQDFLRNLNNIFSSNDEKEKLLVKQITKSLISRIDILDRKTVDLNIEINHNELIYKILNNLP